MNSLLNPLTDLRNIALAVWLLAWIGPVSAYVLSAMDGHVDWCIPHLTGCDSVSATGRHGWGFFVFKATMLPMAGLTFVYWMLCYQWLGSLTQRSGMDKTILTLGLVATVFLVLYVTFLGSHGDVYRALRRYGTVVYFGFTYLAQILLARRLQRLEVAQAVVSWKIRLAVFMFVGGFSFGLLANFFEDDDFLQNISEWNFASALTLFPALTWLAWRRTHFEIRFSTQLSK